MKASELIRTYGWSGPEQGRHQFTRNADNTLRKQMGWTLDGTDNAYRYCVNAAVARVCYGTAENWVNAPATDTIHQAQIRLARAVVQGPVETSTDRDAFDTWSNAIAILARWQDAEGRTADEVIALLETESL